MREHTLLKHLKALILSAALMMLSSGLSTANAEMLPGSISGQELGCLAMNIYHEARGEPEKGKLAVAAVTMNRVKSKYYPNTVCEVVWQNKQFSWTELKHKYHTVTDTKAWINAIEIAQLFIDGGNWPGVGEATHYHTVAVSPNWRDDDQLVGQVGNHLFYTL
ncbi:MAG: cell wall hydrolase [Proteobacteria bacterium]|nr:cell wall hydrolase [Pseudomonadota bacterium]